MTVESGSKESEESGKNLNDVKCFGQRGAGVSVPETGPGRLSSRNSKKIQYG